MHRFPEPQRDPRGVMQCLGGQLIDFLGECGGEQHRLPFGRHEFQDPFDRGQETHVEHAVGFIQYKDFDIAEFDMTLFGQVQQTPGAGHDDLDAITQRADLPGRSNAAVNGGAAQLGAVGQVADAVMDLLGQFTGRGDDQGTGPVARTVHQAVQDGQHEGCRLACAGLGGADQVLTGDRGRDGRFLDGRRFPVAQPVDPRLEARVKVKLSEIQSIPSLQKSSGCQGN